MDWLSPIREFLRFALPFLQSLANVRAILGFIFVFFLPGFAWTLIFFRQINVIERVTISVPLSIAIVTLSLLFLNRLIGLRITEFNSVLVIIVITILPILAYHLNRLLRRRRDDAT